MDILRSLGGTALTTLLSLIVMFLLTKLMGSKQVSQMTLFDYVVGITIGSIAAEMVENMRFNIAFLGVSGYFPGKGFATSVAEDYVLRQKIVERSDCTVILMDSSKASSRGIYTFAPLDAVSYVVSDGHLPQEMVDEVTASGVTVL